ncbi:hypothetical protein [Sphingorhabdus sp.]|jgi:hypothetical protein|uniref:hypothetical protein n=1 Tax=Sphingorhabdus sp. TaxID=1902408 RepID=UPI0040541D8F
MTTITIDGLAYDLDSLSDDAKAQLGSMQAVDRRIALVQEEMAILQTARMGYSKALQELLPVNEAKGSEKIQWPN